jgi:hypothetical protein
MKRNMKKYAIIIIVLAWGLVSCNQQPNDTNTLSSRIDSLERKLTQSYTPGIGEFMGSIQTHHSKLWFAGQNQNWKLADFEVHEMMEALENIQKYKSDRKESKMMDMLNPSIDSVKNAIKLKNPLLFERGFIILTNSCNSCHKATEFEFNLVKIPEKSPFTNQEFKNK